VGCSGTTSFDVGDAVFLNDGAILVSASSGAVEFNRRNVVEWANMSESDDLWIAEDLDDGRICCVPDRYIQITMALMVQAAVQAVREEAPGVHSLDVEVSVELTRAFYREVQDVLHWLPDQEDVVDAIGGQ
jgi:hypothetical protein